MKDDFKVFKKLLAFAHGHDYEFLKNCSVAKASDRTGDFIVVDGENVFTVNMNEIIFNHDFMKALCRGKYLDEVVEDWDVAVDNEHAHELLDSYEVWTPDWAYHLMELSVAEDRIEYLKRWFIDYL